MTSPDRNISSPCQERARCILLAEDNPGDVFLVRRALDHSGISYELRHARDGEEALSFVRRAENGEFVIDLLLVDLNLPRYDGAQIVAAVRGAARFKDIPVIMLTSSDSPHDRQRIGELGATFFRKPSDLQSFMELGDLVRSVVSC